jgi:hypothetical protein
VALLAAIVTGVFAVKAARAQWGGRAAGRDSASAEQAVPELDSAIAARIQALETHGPARNERMERSQQDLERLAAALRKKKVLQRLAAALTRKDEGDLQRLVARLARCTDLGEATKLRDQLDTRTTRGS